MNNERILRLRRLSVVPRWAVIPTVCNQNVAEHSFHVCSLVLWLADRSAAVARGSVTREQLMYAALFHDESEALTGDIAAPAKRWMDKSQFDDLSERLGILEFEDDNIKSIIKVADLMEALVFLHEEKAQGNDSVQRIKLDVFNNLAVAWAGFEYYGESHKPGACEIVREILSHLNATRHPCVEQGQ